MANWYFPNHKCRKLISIKPAMTSGSLTNYPMLFKTVRDPDLNAFARPDGRDIAFSSADGTTQYNYERMEHVTGSLICWVGIPFITSSATSSFYIYYGNPNSPDMQNSESVWSNNYKGVYHCADQVNNIIKDSTSNKRFMQSPGGTQTPTSGSAGQIYKSLNFNYATSQYYSASNLTNLPSASENKSLQVWLVQAVPYGTFHNVNGLCCMGGGSTQWGLGVEWFYSPYIDFIINNNPTSTGYTYPGGWVSMTMTYYGGTSSVYINGDYYARQLLVTNATGGLYLGAAYGGTWASTLEEFRVLNATRSQDWIWTEYKNHTSPTIFYISASQEYQGGISVFSSNLISIRI